MRERVRNYNEYGIFLLTVAVIERAVDDYKALLKRYKKSCLKNEKRRLAFDIKVFEDSFFRKSPFMGLSPLTGDEVISKLRKEMNIEVNEESE